MREQMIEAGLWPQDDPRDPSEEIGAAWEVVEKMEEDGWDWRISHVGPGVTAVFDAIWRMGSYGHADTAPEAIALASLKACGVEVEHV